MIPARRKSRQLLVLLSGVAFFLYALSRLYPTGGTEFARLERFMNSRPTIRAVFLKSSFDWSRVPLHYLPKGPTKTRNLPGRRAWDFPTIQNDFGPESELRAEIRQKRREAVRAVAVRDWQMYRAHAWKADALNPISGTGRDQFSGWSAMLVDSLDTLWIMGLKAEFDEAVAAVARIDFGKSTSNRINMFETNIRYLGGLLAAYDLSRRSVLLAKAVELGDLLYAGFNTANRMPVNFISLRDAKLGTGLDVEQWVVSASPGSLSMEMTRLSQITGDMKYFDAVSAVMEVFHEQQAMTRLPGLWPIWVSMRDKNVSRREGFTLGGSADSNHEYLPKMIALLGGKAPMYEAMTRAFMKAATEELFFRPMLPGEEDILISGNVLIDDKGVKEFDPESEHLACFIGGAMSLGGRLLRQPDDVVTGSKLTRGCAHVYNAFPTGIMPERFNMVPCEPLRADQCVWNDTRFVEETQKRPEWKRHLPTGFTTAKDPRYLLRPEAIESVFVNYRITGEPDLQDKAWEMFESVCRWSRAEFGHASIKDVTRTAEEMAKEDYMESFWISETLKYYYLMFSPPDFISLDKWVLNTEAHPFRMPR